MSEPKALCSGMVMGMSKPQPGSRFVTVEVKVDGGNESIFVSIPEQDETLFHFMPGTSVNINIVPKRVNSKV